MRLYDWAHSISKCFISLERNSLFPLIKNQFYQDSHAERFILPYFQMDISNIFSFQPVRKDCISVEVHAWHSYSFFSLLSFFIEVLLIYSIILVSGMQQSDSVLHIYIHFFQILFPYKLLQKWFLWHTFFNSNSEQYTWSVCNFKIRVLWTRSSLVHLFKNKQHYR